MSRVCYSLDMGKRNTIPGSWSEQRVLEVLGLKCVVWALAGKPTPVAARVVARLESKLGA